MIPIYKHRLSMTELHITKVEFEEIKYVDQTVGQPWDTFIFVIKGGVTVKNPRRTVSVTRGELMFIPEGARFHGVWKSEDVSEFYSLRAVVGATDVSDGGFALQKIPTTLSDRIADRFDEIYRLFSVGDRESVLRGFSLYFGMYADILPRMITEPRRKVSPAVIAAAHYIDRHFTEDFSVDELADVCHISASRLHHLFSEQLGTTPTKYRNSVRIEHARILLRQTEVSIEAVAEQCGFNSAAYFREAFKSEIGLTPTEYRSAIYQKVM